MAEKKYDKIYTKEYLQKEYIEKHRSSRNIAKENKSDKETVNYWIKKHGLKIKKISDYGIDLTGEFNGIKVLNSFNDGKSKRWNCICKCGVNFTATTSSLKRGQKGCYLCRNKYISESKWKGVGEISMDFYSSIKRHAKSRNLEFNLSIEYLWNLFILQDRKCALSGVELYFPKRRVINSKKTASLDRIDSLKGYIEGNVQFVHKYINIMKQDFSQQEYKKWCILVAKYNKDNNE